MRMKALPESKQVLYAAFLRGINVGGNKLMKMEDLRKAFESLGFKQVRTLLASGNVLFETAETRTPALTKTIEERLNKRFGSEIAVLVRRVADLRRLHESDPFKGINVTAQTRLWITFLCEKRMGGLKIPYASADGSFKILSATSSAVCSVLTVLPGSRAGFDLMATLEKEFGRKVTTRNWNTIARVLKAAG
jgi:uncharacterized protein (DUF1697 family)